MSATLRDLVDLSLIPKNQSEARLEIWNREGQRTVVVMITVVLDKGNILYFSLNRSRNASFESRRIKVGCVGDGKRCE